MLGLGMGLGRVRRLLEVVPPEPVNLIAPGTFDSGTESWQGARGAETIANDNGALLVTATGTTNYGASVALTGLTVGAVYDVLMDITLSTGQSAFVRVSTNSLLTTGNIALQTVTGTAKVTVSKSFTATAAIMYFGTVNGGNVAGSTTRIDNVSVVPQDPLA